jgi:solute carrier family 25 protein 34/35
VTRNKRYKSVVDAFYKIYKNDGIKGLQKGLTSAYLYQLTMNGVRFGSYDMIKGGIHDLFPNSNVPNVLNVFSGAVSGAVGAALGSPFFLVKTRLQSYSESIGVGHQHNYKNTRDAFLSIYKEFGIQGMFNGVRAAILRTAVGSGK